MFCPLSLDLWFTACVVPSVGGGGAAWVAGAKGLETEEWGAGSFEGIGVEDGDGGDDDDGGGLAGRSVG